MKELVEAVRADDADVIVLQAGVLATHARGEKRVVVNVSDPRQGRDRQAGVLEDEVVLHARLEIPAIVFVVIVSRVNVRRHDRPIGAE